MARPFPTTFEKDSSTNSQSPISYQANVNRQKTRKWAEAKPVDYGGDDWGDDDEYEYDLPPPPPKPTGLRQQGQAMHSPARAETQPIDQSKRYGELPPLPGPNNPRARANSFDIDDEKRNFSNTTATPSTPSSGPATRFSQIVGGPAAATATATASASGPPQLSISTQQPPQSTGLRKPAAVVSPLSNSPHPDILQPGRANTGDSGFVSPASDTRTNTTTPSSIHARHDFSPSAAPLPLSPRAPPASHGAPPDSSTSNARFPARKSSLSQMVNPVSPEVIASANEATPKPWVASHPPSPGVAARSPATPTGKALPFIRPADIYRRVEEERERERQSLDSSRPSMDSVVGSRSSEGSDSPGKANVREKSSFESPSGPGWRSRSSFDGDEASDSGRQLRPKLEPVKERKSEYGFDNVNVDQAAPQEQRPAETQAQSTMSESDLDIEGDRLESTSPKLPDVARLSGFGMDMFSQAQPQVSPASFSKDIETTPTTETTARSSTGTGDPSLHNQNSLGFRSVVNKAFDRTDDASVPPTPASTAGSGIGRNDSQSTGTDGISPIMSRVPSSGPPGIRDAAKMSTLEVVHEPSSPDDNLRDEQKVLLKGSSDIPGFTPGYRRNMRTPSPGNSPSRKADLGHQSLDESGQKAVFSDTIVSPTNNEPLQPPRPVAERDQSFRPALPGGWTSYATTSRSESPVKPYNEKLHTPIAKASEAQDQKGTVDSDLTPITSRPVLSSGLEAAVAGATSGDNAGSISGKHDEVSPLGSPRTQTPQADASQQSLPSNLAVAPSGNVYSSTALDPRYFPQAGQAPETQLRPDAVNRTISMQSSTGPTPPPKDTPDLGTADHSSDYFPQPTAPLKQINTEQTKAADDLKPPAKSKEVPHFSKDARPYDEENDKLHEEIVRSLSPRLSQNLGTEEDTFSDELDDGVAHQARESTYLPSEYDNYWASTAEDTETIPAVAPAPIKVEESTKQLEPEPSVVAPLSPRREGPDLEPARPPLPHRFSWERSSESVISTQPEAASSTPVHELHGHGSASDVPVQGQEISHTQSASPHLTAGNDHDGPEGHPLDQTASQEQYRSRKAAIEGGIALAGVTTAAYAHRPAAQTDRPLSLAEEKDPNVSSHPVSPTPPEDEHPARSPYAYFPTTASESPLHPPLATISPVSSPSQQQNFPSSRPLTFKQIAAINSQHERIQVYEQTRHHYADMNSGLTDWLAALQSQFPEHAGATSSYGGSRPNVPSGSARSKFTRAGGGGAMPQQQQPYYQQYLNASPSNSAPASRSGPGPSISSGSQQGPGVSSNKLTSHQVQAKGKELLHTAGIFGGKAGKAGKGLLAKGKNKLRGAGAGDKTSPPAKPKSNRRSSWGFPLNLSRSSGRPESSPHSVKHQPQVPNPQRPRSATLNSLADLPSPQPTRIIGDNPLRIIIPRVGNLAQEVSSLEVLAQQPESGDLVGTPEPIGKEQPTWDSFNSVPIAEEDVSPINEPTIQNPRSSTESASKKESTLAPIDKPLTVERVNSNDVRLQEALEESPGLNDDWVLVSPNPGLVETPSSQETEAEPPLQHARVAEVKNPMSILHRPRGSYEMPPVQINVGKPKLANSIAKTGQSSEPAANEKATSGSQAGQTVLLSKLNPKASVGQPPLKDFPRDSIFMLAPPLVPEEAKPEGATHSFLPPIRRTSTFQLPFGSRHIRQPRSKFAVENDEQSPLNQTTVANHSQQEHQDMHVPEIDFTQVLGRDTVEQLHSAAKSKETPPLRPLSFIRSGPLKDPALESSSSPQSLHIASQEMPQEYVRLRRMSRQPTTNNQSPPPQLPAENHISVQHSLIPNESSKSSHCLTRDLEAPSIVAPQQSDIPLRPENFQESQVEWRRSRQRPTAPPNSNINWKERDISPPRQSSEHQRGRGYSGSSQKHGQGSDDQSNEIFLNSGSVENAEYPKPFVQPPSSAQRYPELFRQGQQSFNLNEEHHDLPAQYFQAPLPAHATFLPRHQTNEYQLSGIGPPVEEPRPNGTTKRNSGFFRDIGGIISRGSSRERKNSISQDGGMSSPTRLVESRGDDYGASSVASDVAHEQKKRRSAFFGAGHRDSTFGLDSPASHESVIVHNTGSRLDLVSPLSPPVKHDRKRSLFSNHLTEPKSQNVKSNKLLRASTGALHDGKGKKRRFSGFSGLFTKSSQSVSGGGSEYGHLQPTRELSQFERQPIESPQLKNAQTSKFQPPDKSKPPSTRIKHMLAKSSQPRDDSKSRRTSASTLLSSFMGRRSHQLERGSDESRSQGSKGSSQPQNGPRPLPPAQTYTDLVEEQQAMAPPHQQERQKSPFRRGQGIIPPPSLPHPDRGRKIVREPHYDSVPIPGGYTLVRGDGSIPVPTQYDPRGLNLQQQQQYLDPKYTAAVAQNQPQLQNQGYGVQAQGSIVGGQGLMQNIRQQYQNGNGEQQSQYPVLSPGPPQLTPAAQDLVEGTGHTFERSVTPRRLSREDVLARSPPKGPEGQQRPYQLTLPTVGDPEGDSPSSLRTTTDPKDQRRGRTEETGNTKRGRETKTLKNDPVQRLQQPTLRHPQSPAGYPLPDDDVFSPVNEAARDIPPPPPPKWDARLDGVRNQQLQRQQQQQKGANNAGSNYSTSLGAKDLDVGLDRSNTHRTTVSAVSVMSDETARNEGGGNDRKDNNLSVPGDGGSGGRRSPEKIKRTEVEVQPNEDLYDASPRLPKIVTVAPPPDVRGDGEKEQEEKILYDHNHGQAMSLAGEGPGEGEDAMESATMSATSYPGQEWNPYGMGGWEDGLD